MKIKQIITVNYGLASSYDNYIEINKKLTGKLRSKILNHELRHSRGKYDFNDFKNDFYSKDSYFLESLKFSLKNPECLINFFPFMYSYYFKCFTYNSSSLFYFLYLGLIFVGFFLFFGVNPVLSFIGFVNFYVVFNIILLVYTHYYVITHK